MHRYEELERLYYKKLYFKIFLGFLLIVLLGIGVWFFSKKKDNVSKKIVVSNKIIKPKEINKTSKYIEKEKKHIVKKQEIKKQEIKKQEVKKQKTKEKKEVNKLTFVLPEIKAPEPEQIKVKQLEKPRENSNIKKEKPQIKLVTKNVDLKELIQRFNKTKNYNIAITIAKIYLNKGELKKAQIWALKANSLNPENPQSWIVFADILLKKGDKQKAKEILQVYTDSYGNNDIIEEKLRSINGK